MLKVNCLLCVVVVCAAVAMLLTVVDGDDTGEGRRGHKRRKRPCNKESSRWFFAHDITILLGDLTVVNSVPCGVAGVVDKPIVQRPIVSNHISGQRPGLLGQHHHGGHHHGVGLLGSHQQGGGLLGSHQQGGGLLGSHQQGGGLLGSQQQGGGLLGSHHQQSGGLFGQHQQGGGLLSGLFGNHQQGGSGPKPVYEEMEEEGEMATSPYRPGPLVGALTGHVSGYEQDLSHLSVVERINDHIGKLFRPFVDLFLR